MAFKVPEKLFEKLNNNRLLRAYLLFRLPLAYLAGVRVVSFRRESATMRMSYKWINTNPFGSMYFAAMNMGAELACGLLLFAHIQETNPKISMLLESLESEYTKKVTGKVLFICQEGEELESAVQIANESEKAEKIKVRVYATDEIGGIMATFHFHWSLKRLND